MLRTMLITGAVLGLTSAVTPASAQEQNGCSRPKEISDLLHKDYSEKPIAFGVQGDGSLMQVYASRTGETWTVVLTTPTGVSCIVAEGTRWEDLPRQAEGPVA